jgi:hypothetical protein
MVQQISRERLNPDRDAEMQFSSKTTRRLLPYLIAGTLLIASCGPTPEKLPSAPVKIVWPPLTVEETIGAALYTTDCGTGFERWYAVFGRANPDAKEPLYRLLDSESLPMQRGNIYTILGYIGDATDVPEFERRIRMATREDSPYRMLMGVGLLVRRNVDGASELLERLMKREYWDEIDPSWLHPYRGRRFTRADQVVSFALNAYALSLKPDLAEKRAAIIAETVDAEHRSEMEQWSSISMESLKLNVNEYVRGEALPLNAAFGYVPAMRERLAQRGRDWLAAHPREEPPAERPE